MQMDLKALQQQENTPSDRNPNRQRIKSSTAPAGRIESDPKGVAETGSSSGHSCNVESECAITHKKIGFNL